MDCLLNGLYSLFCSHDYTLINTIDYLIIKRKPYEFPDEIKLRIIIFILNDHETLKVLGQVNKKWYSLTNQKLFGALNFSRFPDCYKVIEYNKLNDTERKKAFYNWKSIYLGNIVDEQFKKCTKLYGLKSFDCQYIKQVEVKYNIAQFFIKNFDQITNFFCFKNLAIYIYYEERSKNTFDLSFYYLYIYIHFEKSHEEIDLEEFIKNLTKLKNEYTIEKM